MQNLIWLTNVFDTCSQNQSENLKVDPICNNISIIIVIIILLKLFSLYNPASFYFWSGSLEFDFDFLIWEKK